MTSNWLTITKLKIVWNITQLLAGIMLIAVGVFPIFYVYVIYTHNEPLGPSKPIPTAEALVIACIWVALAVTIVTGISRTTQAIMQFIKRSKEE